MVIPGQDGDQGEPGPQGEMGPFGEPGFAGRQGPAGYSGGNIPGRKGKKINIVQLHSKNNYNENSWVA